MLHPTPTHSDCTQRSGPALDHHCLHARAFKCRQWGHHRSSRSWYCKSAVGHQDVPAEVRAPNDLDTAFQGLAKNGVQAVIVLVDDMLFSERDRVAALAAAVKLPAIYGFRDHVDAGGLVR